MSMYGVSVGGYKKVKQLTLLYPADNKRFRIKKKRIIIPTIRFNTKNNFLIKLLFKQTL